MKSCDWFKTEQICGNTYAIHDSGWGTMYLLEGNDKALLIDTGWGIFDLKKIVKSITSKPILTVLTHGHLDHAGGTCYFDKVFMHKNDINVLSNMLSFNQKKFVIEHLIKKSLPKDFYPKEWLSANSKETTSIEDGYIFHLGNRDVEVILTPGHTTGSIMLFDKTNRLMFTGDNISSGQIWLHFPDSTYISEYLESMKKIIPYTRFLDAFLTPHTFKADISLLDKIINMITEIISGKAESIPFNNFSGNGLIYNKKGLGIVYNENRIINISHKVIHTC